VSEIRVDEILVRGNPNAEEVAAVIATLSQRRMPEVSRYEHWRRGRITALQRRYECEHARRPWDA
jgi:hypothetical protein